MHTAYTHHPKSQSGAASALRDLTGFAHVPEELIERRQWVLWRFEHRPDKKTGELKKTKVPYQVNGTRARSDDPTTWTTWSEALTAYRWNDPPSDGVGFIFHVDDPFVGVDLDNSIAGGKVLDWARETYQKLAPAAYCEISPSGQGLKLWTRGSLPGGGGRRKSGLGPDQKGAVEMYVQRRFFTVTGRRFIEGVMP